MNEVWTCLAHARGLCETCAVVWRVTVVEKVGPGTAKAGPRRCAGRYEY